MSEIVFGSSDAAAAYKIKKMLKGHQIKKISPRLYTTNFTDEISVIIRRNLFKILSNLYPEAVLSHRSAFEIKPTITNQIFVTHSYTKKIRLPGITINFLEGKGPDEDDIKIIGNFYASSRERAFLENLQMTKKSRPDSKALGYQDIKERLKKIFILYGKAELENIREKARYLSESLIMKREYDLLDKIINELIPEQTEAENEPEYHSLL
ncbi:MAG: hypothetical protein R6W90_10595 [Ignavibacteriaceae bacterium]